MHAQILLKSINKLSILINPWLLGSFQIVVFLKFSLSDTCERERERKKGKEQIKLSCCCSLYIQCMLLNNSDSESMIHIVQTIDSWCMLHMSSIYDTWCILFILSIHDVCYICHQSMIHVIECWCLFNVIVINENAHHDTADWWMLVIWYLWHASSMLSMNILYIFLLYNQDLGEF
jgi:hypothetical protein